MPTHPIGTQLIPLGQIHPNPQQVRKDFDPAALEELKNSIRERGLISPLAVWQRGENDFLIIAGERRFRAVSSLGWKEVDCRIWPAGTPPEEVELLSLVENIQRRDLNPLEVAKGYKALTLPPHNLTQAQVAQEIGKDEPAVARSLALLEEPPEIQEKLSQDNLTPAHLRYLDRIKDSGERVKIALKASNDGWSVRETEKQVNRLLGEDGKARPGKGPGRHPKATNGNQPPDPLAEFWPEVRSSPAMVA